MPDESGQPCAIAPAGLGRSDGEALRELAIAEGVSSTIEVGFAIGLSCLFLCDAQLRSGVASPRHVGLDPFQREYFGNAGLLLMRRAGLESIVEFLPEDSKLALPRLAAAGEQFDLGFIDGDHKFESVFADLLNMERLVKPGGLIVVDDTWMPAIRLAISYFEKNAGLELLPDAVPDGFRWTSKTRLRSKEVCPGTGETAVLRVPVDRPERSWDHFVRFW